MDDWHELLGAAGPLAHHVAGFIPRAAQQQMADAVATAIRSRDRLIVEAGTGTGKTFAYLLPAVHSGRKIIISTGTRHLQDQLFHNDLPVIRDALKAPVSTALLKGRTNYLCLHRLALAAGEYPERACERVAWARPRWDRARSPEPPWEEALAWREGRVAALAPAAAHDDEGAALRGAATRRDSALGQQRDQPPLQRERMRAQRRDSERKREHLPCARLV